MFLRASFDASSLCEGIRGIKNNERALLLRDSFVCIKIDGERKSFSSSRGKKIYKKLGFYMIAVFFVTVSIMEKGCFSFLLPPSGFSFYSSNLFSPSFRFIPFIFRFSILTFLTSEKNLSSN